MKDVLREAGKLPEAEQTLRWYAITNEVYPKPEGNGIDMDSFNTQTTGRIASILMMEDTPEKLQYLKSFSRWIDYGCRPAPGLFGSFKSDGGVFHHRNHYPAYAVGGLDGATNMIYLFNHTEFAVSELAHETVKNALLAMRFYCNKLNFPLSMSGRHPDGKGKLVPMHYAVMAMAELRTENRSLTRKWRPLTCVLFQTLPLMGRNRNICRKYRMHRSGRWQNGLWRKDSVPNLTHRKSVIGLWLCIRSASWQLVGGGPRSLPLSLGGGTLFGT